MSNSDESVSLNITNVDVLSRSAPTPKRVNEDRWLAIESPSVPYLFTAAVIDGAGVRKSLPPLIKVLKDSFPDFTPSAYTAYLLKKSLNEQLSVEPEKSLRETLIIANQTIREMISNIFGNFDSSKILSGLDQHLKHDEHNIRLVLPACVVTVARLNLTSRQLEFAHLGDTTLLEIFQDGNVVRHTKDQMGPFDCIAFEQIMALQKEQELSHFRDAMLLPESRNFIIESGLRLNYVDLDGKTDRHNGCGVVNGMSEMEDYIETGVISINPNNTLGFALLTDGLELPTPLHERAEQRIKRFLRTSRLIQKHGLRGLHNEVVRMTDRDIYFDRYPRTKHRDDATGIYIQIEKDE